MAYLVFIMALAVSLTGCITARKVVRERVDQDTSGNQGYLQGETSESTPRRVTTREYIDIKVEIPTWGEVHDKLPEPVKKPRARTSDKQVGGNRGYLTRPDSFEEELPPVRRRQAVVEETEIYEETEIIEETPPAARTYKTKSGDSLSRIAKSFYGKASRWTIIYEANSRKIKDPNTLKPGTVLVIPDITETDSRYTK